MPITFERKFIDVCIDIERKDIMIKALDTYLNHLDNVQASRMVKQRTRWLKEEIEQIKTC